MFEQVNKVKAAAQAKGVDIIDLGIDVYDLAAPDHVIEKMKGDRQTAHGHYSASKGIPGLRRAQAAYYERRFGVKLNPRDTW